MNCISFYLLIAILISGLTLEPCFALNQSKMATAKKCKDLFLKILENESQNAINEFKHNKEEELQKSLLKALKQNSSYSKYSNNPLPIEELRNKKANTVGKFIQIAPEEVNSFPQDLGKGTVSILYVPSSSFHTGHMGIRIGDSVYHTRPEIGIIYEPLSIFVNGSYKGHAIYGYELRVSPRQVKILKDIFRLKMSHPQRYNIVSNNCATNVLEALEHADLLSPPNIAKGDTLLAALYLAKNKKVVAKTMFNGAMKVPRYERVLMTACNRSVLYGLMPIFIIAKRISGGVYSKEALAKLCTQE